MILLNHSNPISIHAFNLEAIPSCESYHPRLRQRLYSEVIYLLVSPCDSKGTPHFWQPANEPNSSSLSHPERAIRLLVNYYFEPAAMSALH
jgi:hypothetical protein